MSQLPEEWFSGNRRTGYYGTLTYAIAMSQVIRAAAYGTMSMHDVTMMIRNELRLFKKIALFITLIFLIWPVRIIFETGAILIHLIAVIESLVSDFLGFFLTIATFGLTMEYELRWCFEAFMLGVEKVTGKLWQRSTVKILDRRKPCKCTSTSRCKSDECFKLEQRLFFTRIFIKCECYGQHIEEILRLKQGYPMGRNYYYTGDIYIERAYPGQGMLISPEEAENCWKCDVELHRPYYDVVRLMWMQSKYSTILGDVDVTEDTVGDVDITEYTAGDVDVTEDTVVVDRERVGLDEIITVETTLTEDEKNELNDWPARIFSRQYAVGEGKRLSFESVKFSKFLMTLVTVVVGIVGIKEETEAGRIAAAVVLLVFLTQAIQALKADIPTSKVFRNPKRAERVLDIDMVSSGRYIKKHNGDNTSWTRHKLVGSEYLGDLSWIENLVGNRSVLYKGKVLCHSRRGTAVWTSSYVADGNAHCTNWKLKVIDREEDSGTKTVGALCKRRVG